MKYYRNTIYSQPGSNAGSPGFDAANLPNIDCDYMADLVSNYLIHDIMLNNNDFIYFVNSYSMNHNETTRLKEYTKEFLLSPNISMDEKNHYGSHVMTYVRFVKCA
jgi:hypothetical protein